MQHSDTPPYQQLTQDRMMDWLEDLGLVSDYHIYPLNSYENRVYRIGIEQQRPIVMKIYRPNRWSPNQIDEELAFTTQLHEAELPVIPPLSIQGKLRHLCDQFQVACFPMRSGHAFELDNLDKLYRIGQLLGRMHQVAQTATFEHRSTLNIDQACSDAQQFFDHSDLIPHDLKDNYLAVLAQLNTLLTPYQTLLDRTQSIRIHGDFHAGNLVCRDDRLLIVDFDDCVIGPAIQDVWKLLSGSHSEQRAQLSELQEGYTLFCDFPTQQTSLIEPLRTVHMIRHALWIGRRWSDPAFTHAFPWFKSSRYWSDHLLNLKEQWALLQDPMAY